jgi:hypothetical protein
MFQFKQPSSGSLPVVLCYSYNSQLKYVIKDGSAVWLYPVLVLCVYHALCRMWLTICTVYCVLCRLWVTFCTVHDTLCRMWGGMWATFHTVYHALCRMWVTFCTVHDTHTKQGLDRIWSHTAEPSLMTYFNWLL